MEQLSLDTIQKLKAYTAGEAYNNLVGYYAKTATTGDIKKTVGFLPDIQQISGISSRLGIAKLTIDDILNTKLPGLEGRLGSRITDLDGKLGGRIEGLKGRVDLFDGRIKLLELLPGNLDLAHRRVGEVFNRVKEIADCIDNRAISFVGDRSLRLWTLTDRLNGRIQAAKGHLQEIAEQFKATKDRYSPVNMYNRVLGDQAGQTFDITGTTIIGWPADRFYMKSENLMDSFRIAAEAHVWIAGKVAVPNDQKIAAHRYVNKQLRTDVHSMLLSPIMEPITNIMESLAEKITKFSEKIEAMNADLASMQKELLSDIGLKPRCVLGSISGEPGKGTIIGGDVGKVGGGGLPPGIGPGGGIEVPGPGMGQRGQEEKTHRVKLE